MKDWKLRILESPEDLLKVEAIQRVVWPGSETDVVPVHLLIAAVHNGGLIIAAEASQEGRSDSPLIGFAFSFPGLQFTNNGPRPKHCSHMLAVHPDHRDSGLGFALKRAQWQMVRHQGLDLITWTYDPLLSLNAHLNIAKLGAVCNTYRREVYGEMRDGLNEGLPSDRFEVEWWLKTKRVERRLSKRARLRLDLAHYFGAGAEIINPTTTGEDGLPIPGEAHLPQATKPETDEVASVLLVEIPSDFHSLKKTSPDLALQWRRHTRSLFEDLFTQGYLVTDFVHLQGPHPRSFYVLSHGESTL
jgi:predicted GNAT superfamily acetyltransferase